MTLINISNSNYDAHKKEKVKDLLKKNIKII